MLIPAAEVSHLWVRLYRLWEKWVGVLLPELGASAIQLCVAAVSYLVIEPQHRNSWVCWIICTWQVYGALNTTILSSPNRCWDWEEDPSKPPRTRHPAFRGHTLLFPDDTRWINKAMSQCFIRHGCNMCMCFSKKSEVLKQFASFPRLSPLKQHSWTNRKYSSCLWTKLMPNGQKDCGHMSSFVSCFCSKVLLWTCQDLLKCRTS